MSIHLAISSLIVTMATGAIGGGWSHWTDWSACTVTCGGGTQVASRACISPPCAGSAIKTQKCNVVRCTIGKCYKTCSEYYPCLNGGRCVSSHQNGDYECSCSPQWNGPYCETPRGEKVRQPCVEECSEYLKCDARSAGFSSCVKQNDGRYRCQCYVIFFGAHCETWFRDACGADGNYRDPTNPYGYVECINGLPYRKSCTGDKKFNAETNKCESSENAISQ